MYYYFLSPPLEVAVNKNNITNIENALLETYKYSTPGSLYDVRRKSTYWSLMHDGISKFRHNLNGFFVRVVDKEFNPVNVPWGLPKVPGAFDTTALGDELIKDISKITMDGKTNARTQVSDYFPDAPSAPPTYLKMGRLREIDKENKIIDVVVEDYPVINCGDGVAVNNSAAVFVSNTWFAQPQCPSTLKRLAKSKMMSVAKIVNLYDCLRSIVQNFKFSIKNKEVLDSSMSMLGLTPIKLINWCGTRMGHFLTA